MSAHPDESFTDFLARIAAEELEAAARTENAHEAKVS